MSTRCHADGAIVNRAQVEADKPGRGAELLRLRTMRGPTRQQQTGAALYRAAVAAARDPWFYRELLVPDTLDGRFDLIGLHAFLLIHRLQDAPDPGPGLAQAVFDAM